MSYCVECGVKLAQSERVCPLCNTRVVNPNETGNASAERPYPHNVEEQIRGLNRRELAWLVLVFLLVPVGATIMIDLLTGPERFAFTWSIYVAAAGAMLCIWTLPPVLFPKLNAYVAISLDSLAVAGLLSVIAWRLDDWNWCLWLGIPIALLAGLTVGIMVAIIRAKRLRALTRASMCCVQLAILIVLIEIVIQFFSHRSFFFGWKLFDWSIYAAAPLIFIALLLFFISRKAGLADELKRRLFV